MTILPAPGIDSSCPDLILSRIRLNSGCPGTDSGRFLADRINSELVPDLILSRVRLHSGFPKVILDSSLADRIDLELALAVP